MTSKVEATVEELMTEKIMMGKKISTHNFKKYHKAYPEYIVRNQQFSSP